MAMWKNVACVVKKMRKDAPANRKDEFDCIFTFKKKHYAQYSLRKKPLLASFAMNMCAYCFSCFIMFRPQLNLGEQCLTLEKCYWISRTQFQNFHTKVCT